MEQQTVKSMTNEQLIGACVWLDREQKKSRAMMNSYKAELQARGLAIMEDHNVKYVKFYGDEGSAAITDSMSLDILNPDKLKELVGEGVYKMKVKEETKTTYKFDSKFEKALKAIFTGDYTFETTLEEFLEEMSIKPDAKQKKLLIKKLKGEFEKDKETLISVLVPEGRKHRTLMWNCGTSTVSRTGNSSGHFCRRRCLTSPSRASGRASWWRPRLPSP